MSVPVVDPGRSIAHRIVSRVAVSPLVIIIATNFGGSRNPAWYHNVKANPIVTLYGVGIRGCFMPERIYDPNAAASFSAPKTAPGPTPSTSGPRRPNPDAFLSSHLRRSAVGATTLWVRPRCGRPCALSRPDDDGRFRRSGSVILSARGRE
jgi:F420H(2)-dependent quinone reductase